MAGGPKCETELEVMSFVHDGMKRGAVGVNLGRNIWQSPHPVPMIRALQAVIHEGASVRQAHEIFRSVVAERNRPRKRNSRNEKGAGRK
jgi:putative autoinducer-2 (AI-2) aldolase